MDELVVHIQAQLQRVVPAPAPQESLKETEIQLTNREAELLKRLYDHHNQVLECFLVLLDLWGQDLFSTAGARTYSSPACAATCATTLMCKS